MLSFDLNSLTLVTLDDTDNRFIGNSESQLILGAAGNDTIAGVGGNNWIFGGPGQDLIEAGEGQDAIYGGQGNDILIAKRGDNLLSGDFGDDTLFGGEGDDTLVGGADDDLIQGRQGQNFLFGNEGNDTLYAGSGEDSLYGGQGDDWLLAREGNNLLSGDRGNDTLYSGSGSDTLIGGEGANTFVLTPGMGNSELAHADLILDYTPNQDSLVLFEGLTEDRLEFLAGEGEFAGDTVIRDRTSGDFLAILRNISDPVVQLDINSDAEEPDLLGFDFDLDEDFDLGFGDDDLPDDEFAPLPAAISSTAVQFTPNSDEATIAASDAQRLTLGSQTIYIGFWQESGINQDPIIASFDSENPENNWVRTDYESTGADGRGQGLFWDGTNLYGVFSTDGTQGSPSEDWRRATGDVTQNWLRSYGAGGGAKVGVLGRIDPATGELLDAAFLSAVLTNGNSNTLTITDITTNEAGNLVVSAQSFFGPRNPDGSRMTQVDTSLSSPFDYTVEITPDLNTVISTSAVGWA